MPTIELSPDLVLVAFLPPLLYGAAFFTPLRELRANAGSISTLAVGLVLATTVAVAVVAHAVIPELTWPTAFVLGAIVSPTDPTAATAIARAARAPAPADRDHRGREPRQRRDGSRRLPRRRRRRRRRQLSRSPRGARRASCSSVIGGILVGLAAGIVIRQVRRRLEQSAGRDHDLDAERVLRVSPRSRGSTFPACWRPSPSAVYMGWYTPELTTPETRLQGQAVWEIVVSCLNAVLFALVGLQLPAMLDELSARGPPGADWLRRGSWAAVVVIAVCLGRGRRLHAADDRRRTARAMPAVEAAVVLSWSGMRGAVSLAAALALPLTTDAGAAFPNRDLIVFLTFARDPRHARRPGSDAARPNPRGSISRTTDSWRKRKRRRGSGLRRPRSSVWTS